LARTNPCLPLQGTLPAVAGAGICARSGREDSTCLIGSLVFLGPTGVGKTEPTRALSQSLFDSGENIVRNLPSEIRHLRSSGAWRRPSGVVLFDETQKVHRDLPASDSPPKPIRALWLRQPGVFNVFRQSLLDGRLTDSEGRTAPPGYGVRISRSGAV